MRWRDRVRAYFGFPPRRHDPRAVPARRHPAMSAGGMRLMNNVSMMIRLAEQGRPAVCTRCGEVIAATVTAVWSGPEAPRHGTCPSDARLPEHLIDDDLRRARIYFSRPDLVEGAGAAEWGNALLDELELLRRGGPAGDVTGGERR